VIRTRGWRRFRPSASIVAPHAIPDVAEVVLLENLRRGFLQDSLGDEVVRARSHFDLGGDFPAQRRHRGQVADDHPAVASTLGREHRDQILENAEVLVVVEISREQ
jgi:hypothetical protein